VISVVWQAAGDKYTVNIYILYNTNTNMYYEVGHCCFLPILLKFMNEVTVSYHSTVHKLLQFMQYH
jgi:hypothetical protein